jgi:hypothetical protein
VDAALTFGQPLGALPCRAEHQAHDAGGAARIDSLLPSDPEPHVPFRCIDLASLDTNRKQKFSRESLRAPAQTMRLHE